MGSEMPAELDEIIRREIAARGAIPFCRFMELALYHVEQIGRAHV